jgi:hypothetical protein
MSPLRQASGNPRRLRETSVNAIIVIRNVTYCSEGRITSGCSKIPDFSPAQPWHAETRLVPGKAAASKEARGYGPYFVGPFALIIGYRCPVKG